MTTSSTYAWNPTIDEISRESCDRAGIAWDNITTHQVVSARFSLNAIFSNWQNKGIRQWLVEARTQTVTINVPTYSMDTRSIDVVSMVLTRSSVDLEMEPISRADYQVIPNKTQTGRPDRYFIDRAIAIPIITVWPTPENSTDVLNYNQVRRFQDVTGPSETADVTWRWNEALFSELAMRLAEKFNPERYERLKKSAMEAFANAAREDREKVDTRFRLSYR